MLKEPLSTDPLLARLDEITLHLKRIDSRDRMRMIASSIRSVIGLIVLVVVLWSSIYLVQHLDDVVKTMIGDVATKSGSANLLQQMQQMFK